MLQKDCGFVRCVAFWYLSTLDVDVLEDGF